MSSAPGRPHTRRGERNGAYATGARKPLCQSGYGFDTQDLGQPDPACPCQACVKYWRNR